ncbi:chaperonin GroES [Fictibacillus solisalsi]|uniref:Co-chaperonin GroES n=1 Tax=Fictibacillus solisalsi TaxID=459525 RepID=A0A1G9VJU4_9BACL|nr:co-chaperone GroES [Fictibacillus solisalsi]SDM72380.1 chaperonin GroES [Fictibacillus solisalsi]
MVKPIGSRVLLEINVKEETTASGIILPDQAKEKPTKGKIVAVGRGRYENGSLIPPEVKEGDTVIYSKFAGTEIKQNDKEYLILNESDILAVIDDVEESAEKELVQHA